MLLLVYRQAKNPRPKKSKRMHILSDFFGRGSFTSKGSATSDNASEEEIGECSHDIMYKS